MAKTIRGDELHEIIIDEEFRDLLSSADSDIERQQLLENIKVDGCRDAIIAWSTIDGDVVIDGHNRLSICKELDIACQIELLSFDSRADVLRWMWENQRGRRNMTRQQLSLLRGKLYNETKKAPGRPKGKPNPGDENKPDQNEPVKSAGETADIVAEETGVSRATVKRDGKRAEMLDKIKVPEIVKGFKAGKYKISDKSLAKLGKLSKSEQAGVLKRVTAGQTKWNKYLDPKRGAAKKSSSFDNKKIDDLLGKIMRAFDEKNESSASKTRHADCIARTSSLFAAWGKWKMEGSK